MTLHPITTQEREALAAALSAYEQACAEPHVPFVGRSLEHTGRINRCLWPLVDAAKACGFEGSVTGVVGWARVAADAQRAA